MASRIPKYASAYPRDQLAYFLCKSPKCNSSRHGLVSRHPWTKGGAMLDQTLFVTCLKCGTKQYDSYNWSHV